MARITIANAEAAGHVVFHGDRPHYWLPGPQAQRVDCLTELEAQLLEALNTVTDAYERYCESADDWCGGTDCYRCGRNASRIAKARAAIAAADREKPHA